VNSLYCVLIASYVDLFEFLWALCIAFFSLVAVWAVNAFNHFHVHLFFMRKDSYLFDVASRHYL